ncbi:hypothetical protein BH20VER3_BH20VER3_00660 [soil metagenome]
MSEQTDALNRAVREKGISIDGPRPALPGLENEADRPDLPKVKLPRGGRRLNEFAGEVGAIVGANGLFRREAVPVTVDREHGRIEDMGPSRFRSYVENQMVCYEEQFTKKTGLTIIPETMNSEEARGCLDSDVFRYRLRKILRVNFVRLPVMRADGRIELLPKGYDAESGIFTKKDCLEYDTDWELDRAKLFFDNFLAEVPFANPRSKAVHLCGAVAVFGAALLGRGSKRLNFCYRANKPRSGKGLFLQSVLVGPCGPFVQIQAISESKEEFRKVLDTEALNGSTYIVFDEVENRLRNRTLNAFITATEWTGRLMNSQRKFAVEQQAIVFIAGNNIELSGDLAGRFLLIDLYVAEADPQKRVIHHVIDEAYLARDDVRADLLSAAWAIVRSWDKAGRPEPATVFRGFETFSRLFGGMIEHAGYANPLESTAAEVDPDYADMLTMVERLAQDVDARAEYEFHALIDVCRELHLFEWHLDGKVMKTKVADEGPDAEGFVGGTREIERFDLTPANKSWFGKLFSDAYGGTMFTLKDGRRVQFGQRGKNRQRRYTIEVVVDEPAAGPAPSN